MAERHGMIFPPLLMNEWLRIATDSMPNSNLSFKCLQWSIPHKRFLKQTFLLYYPIPSLYQGNERSVVLLSGALDVAGFDPVVAAVAVLRPFRVHLVALRVGRGPRGAPEQFALIVVGPARALVAKRFPHAARLAVHLEHVHRAVLALPGAVLGQVALVLGASALGARGFRPARFQVAALARRAARVAVQHARGHVAARIVAVLLQPAVALLPGLHEPVAADRAVEQLLRLVPQAIIHPVLERERQVLEGAGRPVGRPRRAARRRHDASAIKRNGAVFRGLDR